LIVIYYEEIIIHMFYHFIDVFTYGGRVNFHTIN